MKKKEPNQEIIERRNQLKIIPLNFPVTKEDLNEIYSQDEKD